MSKLSRENQVLRAALSEIIGAIRDAEDVDEHKGTNLPGNIDEACRKAERDLARSEEV